MKLRTLLIILVVLIAALGVIFYFLTRPSATTTTTTGQTGSLPSVGTQQVATTTTQSGTGTSSTTPAFSASSSTSFGIVSNDPALDYFVDSQNNTTIVEPNGVIETISNGQATALSSSPIANIVGASFSYDGKKILVSFGSANQPQTSIFDITTKSWTPLAGTLLGPAWSPASYQIAYLTANTGNGTESILMQNAASTSTRPTTLATVAMNDMTLQWVNKGTLLLADKPSVYTVGSAWFFNTTNKTLTPEVLEYPGMESLWSATTSTVGIVFLGNSGNQGGHVNFVNASGNAQTLTFVTLPSKCAFHTDISTSTPQTASSSASSTTKVASSTAITTTSLLNLYCAIPRDQQTLSIARLPDEYNQEILFTADDFYKMNTANGALTSVFSDPNQTLDATDLKVFNNTLFFVNRYDEKVYAIAL
jgi:hypothetical protein